MMTTTNQSTNKSWVLIAGTIRAQAHEAYYKTLNLDQRILYVENYLFAKAWYVAHTGLPPDRPTNTKRTYVVRCHHQVELLHPQPRHSIPT
jgi:hypothetical protein